MSQKTARSARQRKAPAKPRTAKAEAPEPIAAEQPLAPGLRLEPFKVECRLVVAAKDAEGNVVGEQPTVEFALYRTQFDKLEDRINELWPQVAAALNGG